MALPGACNEGEDVIAWVMKRQEVSYRRAVELLGEGDATPGRHQSKERTNIL